MWRARRPTTCSSRRRPRRRSSSRRLPRRRSSPSSRASRRSSAMSSRARLGLTARNRRLRAEETQVPAEIVVTEFVSLDGVMEAPGGEPDFKYPGWTFEFDRGDDGNQFKLDETREADGLLIGRKTYDSFAGAWPGRDGEFADKFNAMPKFVVSTTLHDPEWNNTT